MRNASGVRQLWDDLGRVGRDQLHDTSGWPHLFPADDPFQFYAAFYDLMIDGSNSARIAEFVRRGLAEPLRFPLDDDFILYTNWPTEFSDGSWAEITLDVDRITRLPDALELRQDVREANGRVVPIAGLVEVLERTPFYLPEGLVDDDGEIAFHLPLNRDVAVRLMARNQLRFRELFDTLVMDGGRKVNAHSHEGRSANLTRITKACRALSGEMGKIVAMETHVRLDGDEAKLQVEFKPSRSIPCLPNSVTWAWTQLMNLVRDNVTCARCARPRCYRIFEMSRPDQRYCSRKCGDAHRRFLQRKGDDRAGGD